MALDDVMVNEPCPQLRICPGRPNTIHRSIVISLEFGTEFVAVILKVGLDDMPGHEPFMLEWANQRRLAHMVTTTLTI